MRRRILGLALLVVGLGADGARADGVELALSPDSAFARGARTQVRDVELMAVEAFNDTLRMARERGEWWAESFIAIGLRFARPSPWGWNQAVEVRIHPEAWEPGLPLGWARVTIEDRGWHDDAASGERWMIWITPAEAGEGLVIARGLRAVECRRMDAWFYSACGCP